MRFIQRVTLAGGQRSDFPLVSALSRDYRLIAQLVCVASLWGRYGFKKRTTPGAPAYGISCSSAHASHCRQAVLDCALASSKVDTRSERAIGVTVSDQNQRRWSGPPRVS